MILLCDLGKPLDLSGLGLLLFKPRKLASTIPHRLLGSNVYGLEPLDPAASPWLAGRGQRGWRDACLTRRCPGRFILCLSRETARL